MTEKITLFAISTPLQYTLFAPKILHNLCFPFLPGITVVPKKLKTVYLLTYLGPSLLVEHRPSTTPRQRARNWAFRSPSFQLYPISFSSVSVSRRQLFQGLPLFLLPWGFHLRACRVMLLGAFRRAWPIQPHFLLKIRSPTDYCSPRCHSSSLRIFSGHQMLKMRLRQPFMKIWIFWSAFLVRVHGSDP